MEQALEVSLRGGEFRKLMERKFSQVRETFNLKMVEIDVLYFLSRDSRYDTPTDIYNQLKLNRGHISQAIDSLGKKGYILPVPDRDDHRYVHYELTPDAEPALEQIRSIRKELDELLFRDISGQEMETFKLVSRKICRNLREILG